MISLEAKWNKVFNPKREAFQPVIVKRSFSTNLPKTEFINESSNSKNESEKTPRIVGYWYLFTASLVFSIVVVGGLTRLTESGLSITEWNLIKGMKPPANEQEWKQEFEKYQQFPEYKLLNHNITLDEFKFIFYMEWSHRMLGRFIGLAVILPGLYFWRKGYFTKSLSKRYLLISSMVGCQGLLGWYMVKSGLDDEIIEKNKVPRVSHYWLAAHLGSAFLIYTVMLSTALKVLGTTRSVVPKAFKSASHGLTGLVFLTAISGALVAGLDAGLIYNEFPMMGSGLVPSDYWNYSNERFEERISWWRNILENPSAVQFNHRWLAISTFAGISGLWIASRSIPLLRPSRLAMNALMGVAIIQVTLGISTLIFFVPTEIAALHQGGSLSLLTAAIFLLHTIKRVPK